MAYECIRQLCGPLVLRKIRAVRGREHLPKEYPFIIAANHGGFLDAPALAVLMFEHYNRPVYFFTKEEYWKRLGGRLSGNWLGLIPVYYQDKRRSLLEAIATVRRGQSVGIFPEGTRNTDPIELRRAKTGAVRLALETGAPLVPVGIRNGTGHSFWEVFRSMFTKQGFIDITIGKPMSLKEFVGKPISRELLEQANRTVMRGIGALCGKHYRF
ncbi:MAG: lysophospholipid acyltransferase family protein [Patescibacteria group bacterium]